MHKKKRMNDTSEKIISRRINFMLREYIKDGSVVPTRKIGNSYLITYKDKATYKNVHKMLSTSGYKLSKLDDDLYKVYDIKRNLIIVRVSAPPPRKGTSRLPRPPKKTKANNNTK